jgi:carboxypeptidase Taq
VANTSNPRELWEKVRGWAQEVALIESIDAVLSWDERTMLPPAAGSYRAEQIAYVARWLHERRTDPRAGEWLEALASGPLPDEDQPLVAASLRELRRQYDKARRLPQKLVEELSRVTVLAQQAWVEARRCSRFADFRPWLEKIIRLKREQAQAAGYSSHPYDALIDDYEPTAQTAQIARTLDELCQRLVPLVHAIGQAQVTVPAAILERHYPRNAQEQFGRAVAERVGFDFQRGRLDETVHPFCTTLGPDDHRITTRYDEHFFPTAFFGILHETGHALYEQGLPVEWYGLAPGITASLGVHESQSRLWENFVGRSLPFWQFAFPWAQSYFPAALSDVSLDAFYAAVNRVQPSLIRVEADEATYNLHIIIRFQLELALITGELPVEDVPAAWNEKYRDYLGITPANDAQGCLQDIHWSSGLFGYFPTYSLGNIYAAQLFEAAQAELGDWAQLAARGEFQPLLEWLRRYVHRSGRCLYAGELIERVTGRPPSAEPLMKYLSAKFAPLYKIAH